MSQKDLSGLSIQIVSTTVRIPNETTIPLDHSGKTTTHHEITDGKNGGANF